MKPKITRIKRFFSGTLALLLILNTACGTHAFTLGEEQRIKRLVAMGGNLDAEVNTVEPVLVDQSVDSDGNMTLVFDTPVDSDSESKNSSSASRPAGAAGDEHNSLSDEDAKAAIQLIRPDRTKSDDATRPVPKTKEEIIRELRRVEQELKDEKVRWERISAESKERQDEFEHEHKNLMGDVSDSIDDAHRVAAGQIENAKHIRDQLIFVHNSSTEKIYAALGLDPRASNPSDAARHIRPLTPYERTVSEFKNANRMLRASSQEPALNDSADALAELAKKSAQRGDLVSFDVRMDAARAFAWASQDKRPREEDALRSALELSNGAKSLEQQGLYSTADTAASLAKKLVHVALDVARLSSIVDLPLSVMEAFSGRTIDFDEDGNAFMRDCNSWERGFAVGTLVLGTGGVLMGATPVAVVAGAAGKLLNAFKESSVLSAGLETGERIIEETLTVAKEIDRVAPTLMAKTSLSPYAKKHIWHGEIRISHDKTKIRIDGGLHTQEGLKDYLAQATIDNAPVSREMLSNGVERVVFPDSALTGREKRKLAEAAIYGVGEKNGKTIFPSHWTPEMIEKSIQRAAHEGKIVSVGEKGFKKEVTEDGVTVIVNFGKDGRPNSAFPKWNQGE